MHLGTENMLLPQMCSVVTGTAVCNANYFNNREEGEKEKDELKGYIYNQGCICAKSLEDAPR